MTAPLRAPRADSMINLRVSAETRRLIDSAAAAAGKSRTEFLLESATARAAEVLLDQAFFSLDAEAWDRFNAILDAPPPPNEALKALMRKKAPWEK